MLASQCQPLQPGAYPRKTRNPKLETQNSKPKTRNPKLANSQARKLLNPNTFGYLSHLDPLHLTKKKSLTTPHFPFKYSSILLYPYSPTRAASLESCGFN